jgi:transcriptional regulator with XRE-family HTH domain
MSRLGDLHEEWSKEPAYRDEYERLGPEFELARALIEARTMAGLTQAELALRMGTTQSVIARLESGRVQPTTATLQRLARATGTRLRITFESVGAES